MREVAGRVLIDAARDAAGKAHAPYSRFGVGAAALLADGRIVTGANFENASYGLSLCAETVALATANSQGALREVVAIGVIGGALAKDGTISGSGLVTPCGRCRQIINEAAQLSGRDIDIHCGSADGAGYAHFRASELLPHAFGPTDLGIE
ncbi:cytidine deaminase [Rhizorhabdus dicambivorans]|uniref:Cytidine deaminase n=1 Tax=Rhizorhabdus dicambivorans TaxID=1850238 RepID=A0A2A4FY50_9SPHN|nr:cytidine deaminase [Rhizorhabdus dicambivorans]ATE67181.1 cytidine deaminase [Rhizorhabdus dicambivorans]PCE42650.1 cytidine deaminase [Rhizorhabdus dicambivorans]